MNEEPIKQVTFEIRHMVGFKLEMVNYPELTSPKKWIQKGLNLLKKHTPRVLNYLSRQKVMAELTEYEVTIEIKPRRRKRKRRWRRKNKKKFTAFERRKRWTIRFFKVWVQKEKAKRLILVVLESLIIPLTPVMALLPGPNVFFYIPALLLYFHYISYKGLRKVDVDDLNLTIVYAGDEKKEEIKEGT
ncbi:MAG: hypothetical protein GY940_21330 [bacterium]|nr:hypothetical protein [bacterium]